MEGRSRFPDVLLEKLRSEDFDGQSMADVSRSILLVGYSDSEYDKEFFSIFNLILDEEREGDSNYREIETLYKDSFLSALSEFRAFFDI